jgi:hypothetical protein
MVNTMKSSLRLRNLQRGEHQQGKFVFFGASVSLFGLFLLVFNAWLGLLAVGAGAGIATWAWRQIPMALSTRELQTLKRELSQAVKRHEKKLAESEKAIFRLSSLLDDYELALGIEELQQDKLRNCHEEIIMEKSRAGVLLNMIRVLKNMENMTRLRVDMREYLDNMATIKRLKALLFSDKTPHLEQMSNALLDAEDVGVKAMEELQQSLLHINAYSEGIRPSLQKRLEMPPNNRETGVRESLRN